MAREKYLYKALRKLLDAEADLSAADFNALAEVTASSAELNLLDGLSAAGNATPSKVMTVDANYQVSGWRRKVVSVDGGGINAAMAGAIVNNAPSTSAIGRATGGREVHRGRRRG
jgi:hypothetical protein